MITAREEAGGDEPDLFEGIGESELEGAMAGLAHDMQAMGDAEDPRVLGRAFRRFGEQTGLDLGPRLEDALQRMERGEDLETIERELEGDDESLDDLFRLKRSAKQLRRPKVDETLYFLDDD